MSRVRLGPRVLAILLGVVIGLPARAATRDDPHRRLDEIRTLTRRGVYAVAESLARQSLAEHERASGPTSARTLDALDALVEVASRAPRGGTAETRSLAERAALLHQARDGSQRPATAESWVRLARSLIAASRFDSAQTLLDRADAVFRRCGASCRASLAYSMLERGTVDFKRGDYDLELVHVRAADSLFEALRPPDSLGLGLASSAMGRSLLALDRDAEAQTWFERALAILQRVADPSHREIGAVTNNLGIIAQDLGDYVRATAMFVRALELDVRAQGPGSATAGLYHDNLSWVRIALGDLTGARRDAEEAIAIRTTLFGPDHPQTVHSLLQLEDVLRVSGDTRESFACAERAYASALRSPGRDSISVARAAASLGQELAEAHRPAEARARFEQALRVRRIPARGDALQTAWLLCQIGKTLAASGDHVAAVARYHEAQEMQEKQPHYFLSATLGSLAASEAALGHLERARWLRARAYAIRDSVVGPESQATLQALADLARAEAALGRRREAVAHALAAEVGARRQLRAMAGALSEREALSYAEVRAGGLDLLLQTAASPGALEPGERARICDALIRSRALVFDDLSDRRRSLRSEDPETARRIADLERARNELATRVVSLTRAQPTESQRQAVAAATLRRDQAERELNQQSAAFRADRAREEIGLDAVRAGLSAGSALVSLARYRESGAGDRDAHANDRYLAWVIRPGADEPAAVALGPAGRIDSLVATWRLALGTPPSSNASRARAQEQRCAAIGGSVRRAIWDPLHVPLGAADRVFVVPDGALQLASFAALPAGRGRYLVESAPLVGILTTERDLVPRDSTAGHGAGLLAIGAPDFERAAGPSPLAVAVSTGEPALRSLVPDSMRRRFAPLPGAGSEVTEIATLWRGSRDPGAGEAVCLTGGDATEEAFKRLAPGRRVLHLATHSFRLTATAPRATLSGTRGVGGLAPSAAVTPRGAVSGLDLSEIGLALAGADRPMGADADDGYLTGEEILSLDLRGVDWAVLSACETGVSDGEFIENVRGFHRALRAAGVSTVVMSLWPVADQPSREWMTALYHARIERHASAAEAARDASLAMLAARRAAGRSTHPFEWASFVAAGDGR